MKTTKNIKSFDTHLTENYGNVGSETRDKFEEEFETFKIGVLIQEARKRQHLTQGERPACMYSFRKAVALKTCFHKTESLKKAIKENNPQFEPCENCTCTRC